MNEVIKHKTPYLQLSCRQMIKGKAKVLSCCSRSPLVAVYIGNLQVRLQASETLRIITAASLLRAALDEDQEQAAASVCSHVNLAQSR